MRRRQSRRTSGKRYDRRDVRTFEEFFEALLDQILDGAGAGFSCEIPDWMFKKMISLCHPDKHGNSETSQEVTRWLLEERRKRIH